MQRATEGRFNEAFAVFMSRRGRKTQFWFSAGGIGRGGC